MALPKPFPRVDRDGYEEGDAGGVLYAKLDGGLGRARLDQQDPATPVSVQWTLTPSEYAAWCEGYASLGRGALSFLQDLVLDGVDGEYEAQFVAGSLRRRRAGWMTIVSAQLEVVPAPEGES